MAVMILLSVTMTLQGSLPSCHTLPAPMTNFGFGQWDSTECGAKRGFKSFCLFVVPFLAPGNTSATI